MTGMKVVMAQPPPPPPKCRTNQDCRVYCSRVGSTPLCFDGVCTCFSKKISPNENAKHSTKAHYKYPS